MRLGTYNLQNRSVSLLTILGFAISGGVDSMALAYLWSQFRLHQPDYNPFVQGFVIDHGLRPGSVEEARAVASRLETLLGKPGRVITLDWSKYGGAGKVNSIETTARQLRFQALGQAARSSNIQCILMGHHADDATETALFRLAKGSQGTGLLGVKSIANIPECDGLFGIRATRGRQRQPSREQILRARARPPAAPGSISTPRHARPQRM